MVIIWLMMVNNSLVGGWATYPPEIHDGFGSVGMMTFPTEWEVIEFMLQTTNQIGLSFI